MFLFDLREAVRSLTRKPAAPLLAVLVLTLGIGANTAIFSLVDTILFRPLPVERSDRLVRLYSSDAPQGGATWTVSEPFAADYREASSLSALEIWSDGLGVGFRAEGRAPERLVATVASEGLFECLGVRAFRGRLFGPLGDPGGNSVVLSYRFWQRVFDADVRAVGTTIQLERRPFVIVGVLPPGFEGIRLDSVPDVWLPLSRIGVAMPAWREQTQYRASTFFHAVGRLKPGVSRAAAQAELGSIAARLGAGKAARAGSEADDPDWREPWPWLEPAEGVAGRGVRTLARLLTAISGLVLALAAADVAGLMLARGEGRRQELAVRVALGGSRLRVARPLLLEALVLSILGAVGGLFVAHLSTEAFLSTWYAAAGPFSAAQGVLAPRVLGATAGLSVLVTLLAGTWPAWRAARMDPLPSFGDATPSGASGWFSARGGLVALQVAVATVMLVGLGTLLRGLWTAARVAPGIDTEGVALANLDLPSGGYDKQGGALFTERLDEALRSAPGVLGSALAVGVPLGGGPRTSVSIDGQTVRIDFAMVTPGYFDALGMPLVRGRGVLRSDTAGATRIAVVNRAFAERYWPGLDPIGRYIRDFTPLDAALVVAGVVGDVRTHGLREPVHPVLYVPLAQFGAAFPWQFGLTAVVRTVGSSIPGTALLESAVGRLDPLLPVLRPRSLGESMGEPFREQRLLADLLGGFGGLALLLAGAGLYGVVSLATESRTREFGLRAALGAGPAQLRRLIHGRALRLAGLGLLVGLLASLAAGRALRPFVFGVAANDALALATAAILVLLVTGLAAEPPARRAGAVDPARALRHH